MARLGPKLAHSPSVIKKDRLHYRKSTTSKGLFRKAFHSIISLPVAHTYSFLPQALTEECTFDKAQLPCGTAAHKDQLCSKMTLTRTPPKVSPLPSSSVPSQTLHILEGKQEGTAVMLKKTSK